MYAFKNRLQGAKAKAVFGASLAVMFALALVGDALAVPPDPIDLAPATDGIMAQVTDSMAIILPIAGILLAVGIAWKLVRKFARA
jgi:hypothetical protein